MSFFCHGLEQMQAMATTLNLIEQGLELLGAGLLLVWGGVAVGALRRAAHRRHLVMSWCRMWGMPVFFIATGLALVFFTRAQG